MMIKPKIPKHPFEKIALSCSGGGYRAASFHLGSISYLNHLIYNGTPLLEHVSMLSTVSGGTITGVVYALGKQKNQSFGEIYTFLLRQLKELDLVKEGIEKLNPEGIWENDLKHKNLINAFAELYDAHFTKGALLGCLDKSTHLDSVIFNSTEFNNAINFRFKNQTAGYSGNQAIKVGSKFSSEIKLSDIMAASSCFPGGFEPIIWPYDFLHDKAPNLQKLVDTKITPVGLMDGGIYDNQGIESILNYKKNKDLEALPYFDLVIISDVASPAMNPYVPFKKIPKEGFYKWTIGDLKIKTKKISRDVDILLLLLVGSFIFFPAVWGFDNNIATGIFFGIATALVILIIGKYFALRRTEELIDYLLNKASQLIPEFYRKKLTNFKLEKISLHRLEPLLMDRMNSLATLLISVFLKVVRRLNYRFLYQDDRYAYRRISNLIKELTDENFKEKSLKEQDDGTMEDNLQKNSVFNGDYTQIIGSQIKEVVDKASKFGTTLWFTDDEQLDDMLKHLVCTGQFTMCYNLLKYMEELIFSPDNGYSELDHEIKNSLWVTYQSCKSDWNIFKKDPAFLY